MAYRRSLSTRATITARQCHPSVGHLVHDDDRKQNPVSESVSSQNWNSLLQKRLFGNEVGKLGLGFSQDRRFSSALASPSNSSFAFCRYMSTTIGEDSDKFGIMSDVAEVISDSTVQAVASQVPQVNEVAIAAADSFLPVKLLQYLIEGVHTFVGVDWWLAIALTTLLIRTSTVPLLINQLKSTSKLSLMRPRLEEIKRQIDEGAVNQIEGQRQMSDLFKEYGVTPFTPLKGLFIQGPIFISFFLAVSNMAEKVPSFKTGGAYWFVDLTTPDALYIFPVLTALTFLITVECNMQEGLEGNPVAATMKNVSRGIAVLTVPFTMSFPKAIFCYWITSNLFSLVYGLALKKPQVKKFLGIPEIPVTQPSTTQQPSFKSLFSALKQRTTVTQENTSSPAQSFKLTDRKISSSAVVSQRLRSLEKQVKGRKKNKKN
ncbi:mitochondrial inner membrane protein OXA1 [Morus notabilis]|uniref:mitochondrial inner membrane protein OXA1 n=1 Tax=Morus notabilis TaxID=981085 RepID=UPI000CED279B|nr:mitochondrial inner membrane protein OXA1 [Morus notabilis]XP_024019673.1 mitochondrial inner membrane protein OXA1 [Morus notabilis]